MEFALVLPILLLLLFGIVEFGRAYNAQLTLTHAAREGVRIQALGGSAAEVTAATLSAATGSWTDDITVTPGDCVSGTPTRVTATYAMPLVAPAILPMVGDSITLTGIGEMRCGG